MCVTSRNILDSPLPVQTNRFQIEGITQCRSPPKMRTSDFILYCHGWKVFAHEIIFIYYQIVSNQYKYVLWHYLCNSYISPTNTRETDY